jgi:hypothetical protein
MESESKRQRVTGPVLPPKSVGPSRPVGSSRPGPSLPEDTQPASVGPTRPPTSTTGPALPPGFQRPSTGPARPPVAVGPTRPPTEILTYYSNKVPPALLCCWLKPSKCWCGGTNLPFTCVLIALQDEGDGDSSEGEGPTLPGEIDEACEPFNPYSTIRIT